MTFEEKIRDFFKKHDPGRAYLAPRIAKEFMRDKDLVLEHLAKRYAQGPVEYKGRKGKPAISAPAAPAPEMLDTSTTHTEEPAEAVSDATTEAPAAEVTENVEISNSDNGVEEATESHTETAESHTEAADAAVHDAMDAASDDAEAVTADSEEAPKKKGLFGRKKKK